MRTLLRVLVPLLFAGLLWSCSNNPAKSTAEEAPKEEVPATTEETSEEPQATEESPGEPVAELTVEDFQSYYDSVTNLLDKEDESYVVVISTDVYESSSRITWVLDDEAEVLAFKEEYAIESMEGSREYYYYHGRMVCYMEEESAGDDVETTYFCKNVGGLLTRRNDMEDTINTEKVTNGGLTQKEQMISQSFDDMVKLLEDYEVTTKNGDEYIIEIEEESEYDGVDTTNKMKISIPKEIYTKLVGGEE